MRERARVAPERRPQDEGLAGLARAAEGRRQRHAAGGRGDHRVVRGGQLGGVALAFEPVHREARLLDLGVEVSQRLRHVISLATEAVHFDAVALGQQLIERKPVGRQVVGDECDRHRSEGLSCVNVLILHNRYREPGGEERSVAEIGALLRERGHRVELLERESATAGRLRAARSLLRGGIDPEAVADAVRATGAEVVHAHNINPLLGPRALEAARAAGARVVMHLHNYRLVCSVAITYRDGAPCTLCHGRNTLPGLRHRCRGGVAESFAYATGISRAQPRVLAAVDRFAVPSAAARERLGTLGLPTERMQVLPNFLGDGRVRFATARPSTAATRCSPAGWSRKRAPSSRSRPARAPASHWSSPATGPTRLRLHALAANVGGRGALHRPRRCDGHRRAAPRRRLRAGAVAWDEPCPYSVIEALAAGLPVLASELGGLPEMVGAEQTLPAGSLDRWAEAIAALWRDPPATRTAGDGGARTGARSVQRRRASTVA